MEKIKKAKQEKKAADIIILDEGINKKGNEQISICCWGALFPFRGL